MRSRAPRSNWPTSPVTLRALQSTIVFGVVAGVLVLLIGDALVRGSWQQAASLAAPATFGVWAAWLLLVRPSIRVQPDRAVIVNVGRITEVPWGRVVDIRRRLQLVLELDDGRSVEAWGSPFPSRRTPGREADADTALAVVRSAWQSAPAATGAVVRRPDVVALSIGAVTLAALVLGLTVGAR